MRVTVVTPVLNGVKTIEECLASVRSQDYPDIEHLVIDGGSTDGTIAILEKCGVKYLSEKDAGIYDAFNKGVHCAKGDIVHILNADDRYASDSVVSTIVTKMTDDGLDLCHGYVEQYDDSRSYRKRIGRDISRSQLLRKMRVAHPSTFVRSHVYEQFGAFSVGFKVAADHEFLLRVWDKVVVGFVPVIVVMMREGGVSTSQFVMSYRESMAASILNGYPPTLSYLVYVYELVKNIAFCVFRH